MLEVDRRLRDERLATRMLLQVHDELVLEAPERELEAARRLVVECMEGVHPLAAPLVVDTGSGANWVDAKA
jgi:DNA polymerase-1